jgi:nitrite reductase/ring-hydroxylating ferredoxin subunit
VEKKLNQIEQEREEVEVARVGEIPEGGMKHVEVEDKEILVGNWSGKYYAISDRCGHMNGRLSSGYLKENSVTCAMHGVRYDITTGKKTSEPQMAGIVSMLKRLPLPEHTRKALERQERLADEIKTCDVERYDIVVVGASVRIVL